MVIPLANVSNLVHAKYVSNEIINLKKIKKKRRTNEVRTCDILRQSDPLGKLVRSLKRNHSSCERETARNNHEINT